MKTAINARSIPRIKHAEAMRITAVENEKFARSLRDLRSDDWAKPTDCARWDVRGLAAHVVGSAAGQASLLEFRRQVRAGKPVVTEIGAEFWWDGMNEIHVRERADKTGDDLKAEWDEISQRALRARRRLPRPIAWLPLLKLPEPVGRKPVSYLFDMGFTRDVWMHRIDLTHAAGTTFDADAEHDGRIVADLVAEWAETHGEPFTLTLTGPAGGEYVSGDGAEHVEIDTLEFCRTLSGRRAGSGVLRHPLPL
jgi:uncharacterized protein (TIGR03083 family)